MIEGGTKVRACMSPPSWNLPQIGALLPVMAGRLPCRHKRVSMRATENSNGIPVTDRETEEGGDLDFNTFMDGCVDDVKGYVHAQKHYLTLQVTEKASTLMGKAVEHVVLFGVLGMSLLFLNVALSFYLGDLLSSRPLGFVIVAGFYLLLLGAFLLWWKNGARDRFVLDRINDLNDDN